MRCEVFDEAGEHRLRVVTAEPECGRDFCDRCGDCLHCYGDLPCIDDGEHRWIQYGEPKRGISVTAVPPESPSLRELKFTVTIQVRPDSTDDMAERELGATLMDALPKTRHIVGYYFSGASGAVPREPGPEAITAMLVRQFGRDAMRGMLPADVQNYFRAIVEVVLAQGAAPAAAPREPWPESRCMECGGGWDATGKYYAFDANCCRDNQHGKLRGASSEDPT